MALGEATEAPRELSVMTLHEPPVRTEAGTIGAAPPSRRHRWPWVIGGVVLVVVVAAGVAWGTASRAHPVTMGQAEAALGAVGAGGGSDRPAPGVYRYVGSGTDRLSLPPLAQAEGPTIPGTVTLQGSTCWTFRVDYSSHHWQTWHYCLHQGSLWEVGGQSWQLWAVGPLNFTNLSTFHCAPRSMALPVGGTPGEQWQSRCVGTNTSVKGITVSAGPYRFIGYGTVRVAGRPVPVARFLRVRTDSGAQQGTERSVVSFDTRTGLPIRLEQQLTIHTATPFGQSTYTQKGALTLASLTPER
jgi:hypothetical protein